VCSYVGSSKRANAFWGVWRVDPKNAMLGIFEEAKDFEHSVFLILVSKPGLEVYIQTLFRRRSQTTYQHERATNYDLQSIVHIGWLVNLSASSAFLLK
jgi:hypothetical protein